MTRAPGQEEEIRAPETSLSSQSRFPKPHGCPLLAATATPNPLPRAALFLGSICANQARSRRQ